MAPKFGTSGVRGLVSELTETLVRDYTRAFLSSCYTGSDLYVGRDLRPSSPEIAGWIIKEALAGGFNVFDCGALPTPALAFAAKGYAAIMVTGSHIPADRNGIEILRAKRRDHQIRRDPDPWPRSATPGPNGTHAAQRHTCDASTAFIERVTRTAYGANALSGLRVGVYEHSSVARDLLGGSHGASRRETSLYCAFRNVYPRRHRSA